MGGRMTLFDRATELILKHEGGYVYDAMDAGLETNMGISRRSYPDLDLKNLTREDAIAIYRRDFWDGQRCHQMPPAVALVFYDACINQGPYAAACDLQGALGVPIDGILGPVTMAAVGALPPRDVVTRLVARRAMRYALHRQLTRYGLGWFTRLADVAFVAAGLP